MPTVDHDRIAAMLELGAPVRIVAERLGCSERHVRRIRQRHDLQHSPTWCWGTMHERDLIWGVLADMGKSVSEIAYCVGRSRQAVHAWHRDDQAAKIDAYSANPENWQ